MSKKWEMVFCEVHNVGFVPDTFVCPKCFEDANAILKGLKEENQSLRTQVSALKERLQKVHSILKPWQFAEDNGDTDSALEVLEALLTKSEANTEDGE